MTTPPTALTLDAAPEIAAIREALAAGPTPGPWHHDSDPISGDPLGRVRYRVTATGRTITQTYYSSAQTGAPFKSGEADNRYIAACNPAAMTAVLATIAQLEARLREAEERLRRSRDAGLMLSNFAFNMAHREGRTLSADDCASLKLMYERWDAAIAAHGKDGT